ncbi:hypothetical protein SynBIOSU31_02952 [Synechococcus sp. BIOS-U3-1]|nr:hypothetical protein SynBIOSU31_02952 [Synechococcus sp. BIOS-U3-1]
MLRFEPLQSSPSSPLINYIRQPQAVGEEIPVRVFVLIGSS